LSLELPRTGHFAAVVVARDTILVSAENGGFVIHIWCRKIGVVRSLEPSGLGQTVGTPDLDRIRGEKILMEKHNVRIPAGLAQHIVLVIVAPHEFPAQFPYFIIIAREHPQPSPVAIAVRRPIVEHAVEHPHGACAPLAEMRMTVLITGRVITEPTRPHVDVKLPWHDIKPSIGDLQNQLAVEVGVVPLELGVHKFHLETFPTIVIAPCGGCAVKEFSAQTISLGCQQ